MVDDDDGHDQEDKYERISNHCKGHDCDHGCDSNQPFMIMLKINRMIYTIIFVLTKPIMIIMLKIMMMMVAIIMAISYVMTMFKMVDEIDNGYADDDD